MGQLYYRNLHSLFFENIPQNATDFYGISGFVGPDPIRKLSEMPFNSSLIYGLQRENPNVQLHNQLVGLHRGRMSILYPDVPSHAKCYLWMNEQRPIRGLIGSANFSVNGLNNDYRETLLEVDRQDLFAIKAYIDLILDSSHPCVDVQVFNRGARINQALNEKCVLELYDPKTGQVQSGSGLNWGFAKAHVTPNDAYIPIRKSYIRNFPSLFPPVFYNPDEGHRSRKIHEKVEILWDDGTSMEALFEGSQELDGKSYPKQISSLPRKNILGEYLRRRLGLSPVSQYRRENERITRQILERYGRNSITLSLIQPGIYFADFSTR